MELIRKANEVLRGIKFPIEVQLKFEDFDLKDFKVQNYLVKSDSYLISTNGAFKIFLRFPFYVSYGDDALIVPDEEIYKSLKWGINFTITGMSVTEMQALEVKCKDFTFQAFAGFSYGWGIYQNEKEVMQHYGFDEGIEFKEQ